MEKTIHKIQSIHSPDFAQAIERERKEMLVLPAFDLEEWIGRKPVRNGRAEEDFLLQDRADSDYNRAYAAWLYTSPLPMEMAFWNILVEPKPPKQMSVGGIIMASEAVEAEAFKTNIGRIVHMGDGAFRSRTSGGIDLSRGRVPQIGEHIVHRHYTGLEMVISETGKRLRIMDDTDVLGFVKNPDDWRMYL